MMKRFLFLLLVVAICLSLLCSCKYEYVYDGEYVIPYDALSLTDLVLLRGIPVEMAFDELERKYGEDMTIFVPVAGEYETADGEKFTATVKDYCRLYINEEQEFSRICFFISIYGEDGELIVNNKQFLSYVESPDKTEPDLTYVSEDFAKYWQIIAVRIDELN